MNHSTVDACSAPALVRVSTDHFVKHTENEEEEDGCVILGLLSALVTYLLLAIAVGGAWRLYQLFG